MPETNAGQRSGPGATRRPAARRFRWLVSGIAVLLGATAGAEPLLHEYIELGPGDGPVEPAITGDLGTSARGATDPNATGGAPPGEPGGPNVGSTFSIDRDTTRPERVSYADPFTPTVVPFKRAMVFDGVNREGHLLVRDDQLVDVPTVTGPRPNDESFHASFELDLNANERVPLPSVAAGARLVLVNRDPRVPLRIGADSAENWFVTSSSSRHVRLTLQIVADRRVFGSDYPDVSWRALASALPPVPAEVKQSALQVARALGVDESVRPEQALGSLVEHFRRFSASERRPTSQGLALYRELALTARGICRHRAYAFMITALGLGIPARVALNEAHAWVEVYDGEIWHRIDLGGAASELEMDDQGRPRHVAPRDPFAWPDRRESGLAMAERRVTVGDSPAPAAAPGGGSEPPPDPASPATLPTEAAPPSADPPASDDPAGAAATAPTDPTPAAPEPAPDAAPARVNVKLHTGAERAERGKGLFVSGSVRGENRSCSGARVDVTLARADGDDLPLGSLVSDARGEFRGNLVIPWNAELGEHTLVAVATGCKSRE